MEENKEIEKIPSQNTGLSIDNETANMAVKTFLSIMQQSVQNDAIDKELEKKRLDNEVVIRKIEFDETKLHIENEQDERKNGLTFDFRSKIFAISLFIIGIAACALFSKLGIMGKDEAKTLIITLITLGIANNSDFMQKLFTKNKK